ncbi:MAG: methyl-accepting chemotaxis protein [Corticimicrobacter sp.]|uniref:methyl-accepting chemotaxis protein n=1 Tax=Corticimicrobacter sp. TaxID=2678536 RepID=UPI0032DB0F78
MMHFSDWRVGARLGLGFGVLVFLLIAMGGTALANLAGMHHNMQYVVEDQYPLTVDANTLIQQLNQQTSAYQAILLSDDGNDKGPLVKEIEDTAERITALLESVGKIITDPVSVQAHRNALTLRTDYRASGERILRQVAEHMKAEATREYLNTMRPLQKRYEAELLKLIDREDDQMVDAGEQVKSSYQAAEWLMASLIVAGSILGILIAMFMTRSVTRPLGQAVALANQVAAGNLTANIRHTAKDETGQLLRALGTMNESLRNIVTRVRSGADNIASATAQIAAGNQDLSSRTEEQASSLEETAASMEQITATVKNNASSAGEANRLVGGAASLAQQSVQVMGEVSSTMTEISNASRRIAEIINVIDSIAFQTNILALNAAVEAARAGEQGRGFAVVASEVRNLAQRSATSAKEIKTLIDDSVTTVGRGSALVTQAENIVRDMGKGTEPVIAIVNEISQASHEQSDGIDQINVAIAQIDVTTQQNAALVEEAAAAALSLREQAADLVASIAHLNTGDTIHSQPVSPVRNIAGRMHGQSSQVGTHPAKTHPVSRPALAHTATSAKDTAENDDWSTF